MALTDRTPDSQSRAWLATTRVAAVRRLPATDQRAVVLAGLGAALIGLLLALIAATLYTNRYAGRVYRGVSVAGVELGGLSRAAAVARLEERAAAYAATPARVRVRRGPDGERAWEIAPADLGVAFDAGTAADRALAYGRDGGALDNFGRWFGGLLPGGGTNLPLPATLDEARLQAAIQRWAPEATYWPTDAVFTVSKNGRLEIVPDKDGLGIDVNGTRGAFLNHAAALATRPVTLAQAPVAAEIDVRMLREIEGQAAAITDRPLTLRIGAGSWPLTPEQLRAALRYRKDGARLVVSLDPARLAPFFAQVARDAAQPGVNARLVYENERYVVKPGQQGNVLDEAATLAAIDAALTEGHAEVVGALKPQNPPIVAADLEPIRARAEKIVATPLVVSFGAEPELFQHTFVRADIQPLLRFVEQPDKPEKLAIALDEQGVRALTQFLAGEINQGVRDAEFRWVDRAVRDVVSSRQGREVQFAGTDKALREAILGAAGKATPAVAVTEPKVASSDKAKMNIVEQLGQGRTSFVNSGPRGHNVNLALERLNGTLVPPDAIFSFNEAVGAQTVANGYQEAFGIALVGGGGSRPGQVKTVNSVAGGICQVSTTLFHGVFRAGLPIEERNWHLYWVAYAGPPNSNTGLQGLDATVDDQSGLDFKFKNATGNWLAIEALNLGGVAQITIFGKDPGWQVTIDEPAITDVKKADPKPVEEKTHDLPPGQKRQIETAGDGFTAAIHRRVVDKDGKQLWDTTFRSNYHPSRTVIQVGVPKDQPLDTPPDRPLTGN